MSAPKLTAVALALLVSSQLVEANYNFRSRAFPGGGKPTLKGNQQANDEQAKDNPKAKNVTPQQVIDLSFLP